MTKEELKLYFKDPDKEAWNEDQIFEFWQLVWRTKAATKDFSFHNFVFPRMIIGSFGNPDIERNDRLEKTHPPLANAEFIDCVFLDEADFSRRQFSNSNGTNFVVFKDTIFKKGVSFEKSQFQVDVIFDNVICTSSIFDLSHCLFNRGLYLTGVESFRINLEMAKYSGNVQIIKCIAEYIYLTPTNGPFYSLTVNSCTFKDARLSENKFKGKVSLFNNSIFIIDLKSNVYEDDVSFLMENYSHGFFRKSQFSREKVTILEGFNHGTDRIARLDFSQISSFQNVIFRDIRLDRTNFLHSNLLSGDFNASFDSFDRIRIGYTEGKRTKFSATQDLYRQLKYTFERDKNWDLAAKAFRSEMIMKRKGLFINANKFEDKVLALFDWIFHIVYSGLSGYNQSAVRPLLILIFIITLGSVYYSLFEHNSFSNSLELSFSASFPYLVKISEGLIYDVWWIKLIQTLLSSILMAFFIIALRKKFKQ